MGLLDKLQAGRRRRRRRCLAYGVQGVGKSRWAASADRPVFIPVEDGLQDIECERFPIPKTLAEVYGYVGDLLHDAHDFRHVVIDTADWLERLIWDDVCQECGVKYLQKADGGYGKGYDYAIPRWRLLLDGLDALREHRDMGVIILAHAKHEKFNTPESSGHDRYAPRLHKLAAALIQEWVDEVFFVTYSTITDPARVKIDGTPERIMRTTEGPTHLAKNRLAMPPELPLEWAAYDYYANLPATRASECGESGRERENRSVETVGNAT